MGLSRRKFTREFKVAALRQLEAGASIAEVARSCEINPNVLHCWRRVFSSRQAGSFPGLGKKRADENRVAELGRKIRPADAGDAQLWAATGHHRVAQARLGGQCQAGSADHARRQSACLRRRKFIVTTDSRHGFHVFCNLAGEMELTNINQLRIADITYIWLEA